jgi:hypothetical protein
LKTKAEAKKLNQKAKIKYQKYKSKLKNTEVNAIGKFSISILNRTRI